MSEETPSKLSIFKPQYLKQGGYKGGRSKKELEAGGRKIYKLSSNENMLGSSPKAIEAIRQYVDSLNEYCDNKDDRYRKGLSEFYGGELSPDQFITDNSGVAMLELIVQAFMDPGLESIISNPAFGPYQMFSDRQVSKVIDVPLLEPDFSLDVRGMLDAINENTRLVFLTSPNNPTGTHIPKSQVDELIYNVPDHVVVVYDEVYYQFANADDYTRALPYVLEGKNVIGVNSFSKAYGLAGLRMGYAYSTIEIASYIRQLTRPFHINTLAMEAALAALQDDAFIQKTVTHNEAERAFVLKAVSELGVQYWPSQANFFLIKPPMDTFDFSQKMQDEGVMVRPVANFGAPGCVRITFGTREANEAMLKGLRKVFQK